MGAGALTLAGSIVTPLHRHKPRLTGRGNDRHRVNSMFRHTETNPERPTRR